MILSWKRGKNSRQQSYLMRAGDIWSYCQNTMLDVLKKGKFDPFFRDMTVLPLFCGKIQIWKKHIPTDDKDLVVKL